MWGEASTSRSEMVNSRKEYIRISTLYLHPNTGIQTFVEGMTGNPGMWGNPMGCCGLALFHSQWVKARDKFSTRMPEKLIKGSLYIVGSYRARGEKKYSGRKNNSFYYGTHLMLCTEKPNIVQTNQKRNVYRVHLQYLKAGRKRVLQEFRYNL